MYIIRVLNKVTKLLVEKPYQTKLIIPSICILASTKSYPDDRVSLAMEEQKSNVKAEIRIFFF